LYLIVELLRIRIRSILSPKKVVLISLYEHIGDIVACEPVISYTRDKYNNCHIIWGTNCDYSELLEKHPFVNKLLQFSSFSDWVVLKEVLKKLPLIDEVLDLHIDSRRCLKYGKKLKKEREADHHLYFTSKNLLQSFSKAAGLPALNHAPSFYLNRSKVRQQPLPKKYVVFHTQSNNPLKDWQPKQWERLCAKINTAGYFVIEVGLQSQIYEHSTMYMEFTGKQSLQTIANLIAGSSFFIGVDSGFAHIANALEVDGRVLIGHYTTGNFVFNYYNPFSGKYADPSYIIYPRWGRLRELDADIVFKNIEPQLERIGSAGLVGAGQETFEIKK
jgi:ADP-heptose:LPS heptosyltransferase